MTTQEYTHGSSLTEPMSIFEGTEAHNTFGIIGRSTSFQTALKRVQIAAPTNAAVLIYGEPGSGKDLFAKAIHRLSSYRKGRFIKMNCAAIPDWLFRNESFSQERDAFIGEVAPEASDFKQAYGSTLFLDDVHEIPLEAQPKLLRLLQENENEGSRGTKGNPVRLRIVATSNRSPQILANRHLRKDFYSRLNVFPIYVPPLRDRLEDIPLLVHHFMHKYAGQMSKKVETVSDETIAALQSYHWPGNVQELQNFIQRAVIVSSGNTLHAPLSQIKASRETTKKHATNELHAGEVTLEETERANILKVLDETHWVLGGPNGAARILNMKRTTLLGKMQKLGIVREEEAECLSS